MRQKLDNKRRTVASIIVCVCLLITLFIIILIQYQKKEDDVSDKTPYFSEIEDFNDYTEDEMRIIVSHDSTSNLGCYYGNLSVTDRELFKERFPFLIKNDGVITYTKDEDGNVVTSTQSQLDFAIESYQKDMAVYGDEVIEEAKEQFAEENPDEEIPMYFPVAQLAALDNLIDSNDEQKLSSPVCDFYVNFLIFGNDKTTTNRMTLSDMKASVTDPNGNAINDQYFVTDVNYDEFISWNDEKTADASGIAKVFNQHNGAQIKITVTMENTTIIGSDNLSTGPNKVQSITVANTAPNSINVKIDGWNDYLAIPGTSAYGDSALAKANTPDMWHRAVVVFDMSYEVPTNVAPTVKQNVNKHADGRVLAGTYIYKYKQSNNLTYNNASDTLVRYFNGESLPTIGFFNTVHDAVTLYDINDDRYNNGASQIQATTGFKWNNTNQRYTGNVAPSNRTPSTVDTVTTSSWDNVSMQVNLDYNSSGGNERWHHWIDIQDGKNINGLDDYIWLAASGGASSASSTGATMNILLVQNKETLTLEYNTVDENSDNRKDIMGFWLKKKVP